jgi:hypothetical protein
MSPHPYSTVEGLARPRVEPGNRESRPFMTSTKANAGLAASAGPKMIAVDIDDTLNDFTSTLRNTAFPYSPKYSLSETTFHQYLTRIRDAAPEPGDLLSTEYSFFRHKIHEECYRLATARADGVAFMQWLKLRHWQIFICTRRDLRRVHDSTRRWLIDNGIPFDYLFTALNKIVFCRAWHISYLVDDDVNSITHGPNYGVRVFHPEREGVVTAGGFRSFDEVKGWIQK